jgi:hypothetical protein
VIPLSCGTVERALLLTLAVDNNIIYMHSHSFIRMVDFRRPGLGNQYNPPTLE